MKHSELAKGMRPAAEFALQQGLSHDQAGRGFFLTLLEIALERTSGNQAKAAELLGCSPSYICGVLKGRERRGRRATLRQPAKPFEERHGAAPAVVIGEMEI